MPTPLSEHFTREEMERSQAATRLGIPNRMGASQLAAMQALVTHLVEPLRLVLGRPVRVLSGYRSPRLNAAVGGAPTSQHTRGEAVDIEVPAVYDRAGGVLRPAMPTTDLVRIVAASGLPFDQMIDEAAPGGWVHLSYTARRANRREILSARFIKGRAVYRPLRP